MEQHVCLGMGKKIILLFVICFCCKMSMAQFNCSGLSAVNIAYTGAPQNYTVPAGVTQLRISLTGASGGVASAPSSVAGGGANVYAYVNVVPGDIIRVIIGQKGVDGVNEAGGGGASAVYKNGILIMVAGGGGGEDNTGDGGNGLASENGGDGGSEAGIGSSNGCGTSVDNGKGGTAGNGGNHGEYAANCPHGGGGGGGLNSPGQGNGSLNAGQPGGQGNINGAAGGAGSLDDAAAIHGGWGWAGGGGADDRESGGGGGYAGGGGGPESRNPGGGGSFVAGLGTNGITESAKADGVGTTTGFNGSAIICSAPAITLPVIFGPFTVEQITAGIFIKWTALSEINTAYYEVERSSDGISFTVIANITARGTDAATQQYSFTDNAGLGGKIFYRIKAIDQDKKLTYSGIASVLTDITRLLNIYPNPANDKIKIILPEGWQGVNNRLQIIGTNGQVMMEARLTQNQTELRVKNLAVGIYLIQVINEKNGRQLNGRLAINH